MPIVNFDYKVIDKNVIKKANENVYYHEQSKIYYKFLCCLTSQFWYLPLFAKTNKK